LCRGTCPGWRRRRDTYLELGGARCCSAASVQGGLSTARMTEGPSPDGSCAPCHDAQANSCRATAGGRPAVHACATAMRHHPGPCPRCCRSAMDPDDVQVLLSRNLAARTSHIDVIGAGRIFGARGSYQAAGMVGQCRLHRPGRLHH